MTNLSHGRRKASEPPLLSERPFSAGADHAPCSAARDGSEATWITCPDCDGHGSFRRSHSGSHYYGAPETDDCETCDGECGWEALVEVEEIAPGRIAA